MKIKTLQLLFVVMTIASSFAQTEKGKFLIGLNTPLSFSSSSTRIINSSSGTSFENDSGTSFSFSPQVGYAIIDNLFLGLDLTLAFNTRDTDAVETNSNSYVFSPFVKYYYPIKNDFNFFGQFKYGLGRLSSRSEGIGLLDPMSPNPNVTTKTNMEQLLVGLGVGYFVHEKLNIELSLNYQNIFYDSMVTFSGDQLAIDTFGASIGFSLFL